MSAAELFAGAGSKPGVECWRIEAMKPVKQPSADGKLYTGDSYIVLHTWEQKGSTHMNVHFWIGAESSRDEAGAAALLTVELDQFLGDLPTQFRETQGSESNEFLQLFKNGGAVQQAAFRVYIDPTRADIERRRMVSHCERIRVERITVAHWLSKRTAP